VVSRFFLFLILLGTVGNALADSVVKVGSKAPPIAVAKWVKGSPVDRFEEGKVYVVEFWATWCSTCKECIPHLTELAKKYDGKIVFAGIDVWEEPDPQDDSYIPKVDKFVGDLNEKMGYNVAVDGYAGTMARTWMSAAGQDGIPTAFVIDQHGKVAWIGHPADGLDEVLPQVLDGSFDAKAAAEKSAKDPIADLMAKGKPYMELVLQGEYKGALGAIDASVYYDPKLEKDLAIIRFLALNGSDTAAANHYAGKLLRGLYKDDGQMLLNLAWTMTDDESPGKGADPRLAAQIAERGISLLPLEDSEDRAYNLETLAGAYYKAGSVTKAVSTVEQAIKMAEALKSFDSHDLQELKTRLELYKKAGG
jgi:thiol-disulfide isomerase/thioredoxin